MNSILNFKRNIFSVLFLCFFISNNIYSQGNTCGTAVAITSNASCVYTGGTSVGATYQSNANNGGTPSCASPGAPDVWYSFTPGATGSYVISTSAGTMTDGGMSIYSGACGSMTEIVCDDDSGPGSMPEVSVALTAGTTYYIRIWEYSSGTGTFSICITNPAPAPANDNCSGATAFPAIPTNGTCATLNNQSNAGATNSNVTPTGFCTSNSGTPANDVWFKFVATTTGVSLSATNVSGLTDVYWQIFSGACGASMNSLLCTDTDAGGSVSGLTIGNTYWVRMYTYSGGTTVQNICLSGFTPPSNDNPCGATPVTVNSAFTCTTQTAGTLVNATASGNALGACFGTADDDVWFSFVANNSTQNISLNNITGSTSDLYFSVYSGACGSLGTALICSDPESNTLTGLTVGNTYIIRVYSYTSTSGQTSTFSVCITPPPPVPANDNPCNATTVPVNAAFTCTTQTAGTIAGATASGNALGACFGTADDDVWFKFVANNSTQNISLNNITGSTSDLYFSVYSGACGSLGTALLCSDPESNTLTGLTVGNTYIIRIYSYTSTSGQTSSFSICITPPPPVPANDNPCNATTVPVNAAAGTCTTQTAGTIAGATASGNALGACGGTADDDVWFKFVANSTSMNINLNNITGSTTDLYHSVYSGACGSLGTALICSDPNSSTITGLTIGNTYIIRIYSYTSTSGQTTSFSVCINPTPPPPTNVTCAQMQPICSGSPIVFQAQSSGGSAAPGPNYGCLSTTPNPTWFYLQISTPGTMAIDLTAGSDVDFALWGPYANLATAQANCLTYPAPLDCSYSSSATEQMNISAVTTGQVYAVLVTNYASVIQSITLNQATGATATTNCSILPIELVSFKGKNDGLQNTLEWITASEKNNDYFTIEKSGDAINFEQLAVVAGAGNSTSTLNYSAYDDKPFDITYYRLKQTNYDKTFKYSGTISIDRTKDEERISNVYPNPTKEDINFDVFTKTKSNLLVEVINNKGEQVYKESQLVDEGNTSLKISMNDYRNGVYLLKVTIEQTGKVLLYKVVKD